MRVIHTRIIVLSRGLDQRNKQRGYAARVIVHLLAQALGLAASERIEKRPKLRTVVHLAPVTKLMKQNIIDIARGQGHKKHRKIDVSVRRTAAPVGMALPHERTAVRHARLFRKHLQTGHHHPFHLLAHGLDNSAAEHKLPRAAAEIG